MFSNNNFRFDFYHDLIEEGVDSVLREENKLMVRDSVRALVP